VLVPDLLVYVVGLPVVVMRLLTLTTRQGGIP